MLFKNLFSGRRGRVLAVALAAAIALGALAAGLGSTFAQKTAVTASFADQPNGYRTVAVGATRNYSVVGGSYAVSSNTAIATVPNNDDMTGLPIPVLGVSAGIAVVSVGSTEGLVAAANFQVFDDTNVTSYSIANGGEVVFSKPGTAGSPVTKPTPVTTVPAAAVSKIQWTSMNVSVATVAANGTITAVGKGATIVIGEFTDKWGVKRDLHILVGVGVNLDDDETNNRLGYLQDLVNQGNIILGLPNNPYTNESLGTLQNAVTGGENVLNTTNPANQTIENAITALENALAGLESKQPDDPAGWIKKPGGGWYRPVGHPPHVYEVMNEDKTSKQPPEYIWDDNADGDNNPATGNNNHPAIKDGPITYWVEDPANIWHKVKDDGTLSGNNDPLGGIIWGGADGLPTGSDNLPAKEFGGAYWVSRGQNVWQKVNPNGNNKFALGPLTGGGPDNNPATDGVTPIFPANNNGLPYNDGKYYIGPLTGSGSSPYYIGDKPQGQGGDGKITSTATWLDDATDCYYWLDSNGNMVTTPPGGVPEVATGGRELPPAKTGDTVNWIEIARYGQYSLIVRKSYINWYNNKWNLPDWQRIDFGTSTQYSTSNVRAKINAWFNGTASGNVDKLANTANLRNFTVTNNAPNKVDMGSCKAGKTNSFSTPTTTAARTGDDVAFALSFSEAVNFCSISHDVQDDVPGAPQNRPTTDAAANNNFNRLVIPHAELYGMWLRTPGYTLPGTTGTTAGAIQHDGRAYQFQIIRSGSNPESGLIYPALWVHSGIFN